MSRFERMAPDRDLLRALKKRLNECNGALSDIMKKERIQGRLRIHQGQFFLVLPCEKPRYLKKSERELIKSLAQKTYDRALSIRLKVEKTLLEKLITLFETRPVNALWTRLQPARRALIKPVTLSDAAYAACWKAVRYKRMSFASGEPVLRTGSGIRMRSKSELLIAALLEESSIPYRYEYPLEVETAGGTKKLFRPDFFCLEPSTRKEFVWEHFGLMDDDTYRSEAEKKLQTYVFSGTFKERGFLMTFEEKNHPLDIAEVKRQFSQFLDALKNN